MKQFEINPSVRDELQDYLRRNSLTLKEAMDNESSNHDIAVMIHGGLPALIQKIYSEKKLKKLFWGKREIIYDFISGRLQLSESQQILNKKNGKTIR